MYPICRTYDENKTQLGGRYCGQNFTIVDKRKLSDEILTIIGSYGLECLLLNTGMSLVKIKEFLSGERSGISLDDLFGLSMCEPETLEKLMYCCIKDSLYK